MSKSTAVTSSNQQKNQPTVVSLYDVDDLTAHHCGYCNQDGNISVGMSSELMQSIINNKQPNQMTADFKHFYIPSSRLSTVN